MINVTINSKSQEISKETTIEELLKNLDIQKEGAAVAVNDNVIPRSQHVSFKISNGDRLEIIRAVGGG